jgi:nucleotide-binding universal stress UspA family protein
MIPESPAGGAATDIAIAWDGSRAAARAVADASALIGRAARISVLSVTDDKPMWEAGARRLADSLRDRGLDAEAIVCKRGGRPIGETLQDRAVELGAGLLVMGGYGHSRLREFVLGGATQGVLDAPRIPILMSH